MKRISIMVMALFLILGVQAQEVEKTQLENLEERTEGLENAIAALKKLKVSGYIQTQYQNGQKDASLKVGSANENMQESFDRMGIRRGRIKFLYEEGIASGVFQLDITEKGVGFKDAYLNITDPWFKTSAFKAGIFDRPFGFEISHSSSARETPERSTVFQTLFPDERDLGAMLVLQAAKTSPWNFLKLEAGLFAGNGIKQETDSKKDFIGHLTAAKTIGSDMQYKVGFSYYNGSVFQGTSKTYSMEGDKFVLNDNPNNKGKYAKREYMGIDAQYGLFTAIGMTQLRAEYLFGQQPGLSGSSKSPNASTLPTADTYIRKFTGGYVLLTQDLGQTPFTAVVKYDWYDPNTKVSGDQIGQNGTSKSDLSQNTLGFGALWKVSSALRLQAFYEINKNEKTVALPDYSQDVKNNVFTLRLQYKF